MPPSPSRPDSGRTGAAGALRRVRRIYDRDPGAYDRAMAGEGRLLRLRRREVGEMAHGRVLEVGIGSGLALPYYPRDGSVSALIGVDLAAGMLEPCARRAAGLELPFPVRLIQADAARLPLAGAAFDTVVFNLSLCTIPDPAAALAEAVRCARPGARVVLMEHVLSPHLPVAALQAAVDPVLLWLQADHMTRRTDLLARAAGIRVEREERWFLGVFMLLVGRTPGP